MGGDPHCSLYTWCPPLLFMSRTLIPFSTLAACVLYTQPCVQSRGAGQNTWFYSFSKCLLDAACQALQRRGRSHHCCGLRAFQYVRGLLSTLLLSFRRTLYRGQRVVFQLGKAREIRISYPTFLSRVFCSCFSPFPLGCSYSEIHGPDKWHV